MVSKLHSDVLDSAGITGQCADENEKQPAKRKCCVFCLINVLFYDEMSAKFLQLGERKDKNVLACGLAANDEFFWQEIWV
jgi:hypothetical protein